MKDSKRATEARTFFAEGANCAQSVFTAFSKDMDMTSDQCLKISSAFGGGMGMQSTCGAVTGALMVIGGIKGYASFEDDFAKQEIKRLTRLFLERFAKVKSSLSCRELVGYDFAAKDTTDPALIEKAHLEICPSLVELAVQIVEELLGYTK